MKNAIKTLILACALALGACSPQDDQGRYPGDGVIAIQQAAVQNYVTPYLDGKFYPFTVEPVNVFVGWISGNNWVVYQRKSDSNCTFYQVTSGSTMSNVQLNVGASIGNDTVYLPTTGQNWWVYCSNYGQSWEVDPPNVVGNSGDVISVSASHGNNVIYCGGGTAIDTTNCTSGDGADLVYVRGEGISVATGNGGDIIYQYNYATNNQLRGEGGNDCVFGNGSFVDCGAGSDFSQPNTSGTYNCEMSISSCL